ncbi:MAG: DUF456 domain-containing protein [Flavobacteriales bacterium CG_4_9_14_3_um_filter_40_17]|nr:MAG: DUF456 domain-containing protein [Flavobacteriales bacterium CG_4_9_14_3_um_filter_40_17]
MDIALLVAGFVLAILGLFGSFLPVIPGPPMSWLGLLVLYLTSSVPMNWWILGITLFVTVVVSILDYWIPAAGSKFFGGSKSGAWGATIGLVAGLFIPIPLGFLIGAFAGAFVGEWMHQQDLQQSLKAAFGSFIGLIASGFMKFLVSLTFLFIYLWVFWQHQSAFF